MSTPSPVVGLSDILEGHFPLTNSRPLLDEISQVRQRRMLAVVLSPKLSLDRGVIDALVDVLEPLDQGSALDLFVDGLGAASPEGWRLISMLRERYDSLTALVPFAASPGATQIALGTNDLLMCDAASLSPIEPWDAEGLDIGAQSELRHFERLVRNLVSTEIHAQLFGGAVAKLDARVLGAGERAWYMLKLLTCRGLLTHMDPLVDAQRIENIVQSLCGGDLSTGFPFTRRDCENVLRLDILKPDRALNGAVWRLHRHYRQLFDIEGDWVWNERHYALTYDGFLDTLDERRLLIRIHRLDERGRRVPEAPVLTRWVRPGGQDVVMDKELAL
ncbi:MAG: hypothetical protein EXR76_19770 [Myxococcales bacterium]|nr:hypothetical protein [Myxococcales bacterium]